MCNVRGVTCKVPRAKCHVPRATCKVPRASCEVLGHVPLIGIGYAPACGMGCNRHVDLQCWQLADRLRSEVTEICAQPVVARHLSFCDSFQDAAGSVCHNLAEGFVRYTSPEIVRFFRYSLSSLAEVQDHLQECLTRKFIAQDRFERVWDLSEHTRAKSLKFMKPHLEEVERQSRRKRAGESRKRKHT